MNIFLQTLVLLLIQNGKFPVKEMLRISHIILVVKEGEKLACFRHHESN